MRQHSFYHNRHCLYIYDTSFAGISISVANMYLTELETDTYSIVLFSEPLSVVTGIQWMKLPFLLRLLVTFDSDDWNIPQNIAVTALHTYTATILEPLEFDLEHSSSSS